MYYITNQTNKIIAIDHALLTFLKIDTIEGLTKKIILDEILFSSSEDKIDIIYEDQTHQFTSKVHTLSSVLGDFRLVHLSLIEVEKNTFEPETEEPIFIKSDLDISNVEIDTLILKDESVDDIKKVNISYDNDTNIYDTEDELSNLIIPNSPDTTIDEISISTEEMPLILDEHKEKDLSIESIPLQETLSIDNAEPIVEEVAPIIININNISQSIGISQDDYKLFLDEYIDTAIKLENDLKSDTHEVRTTAIETLIQLAEVLHLPKVNNLVSNIDALPENKRIKAITTFYNTLSNIILKTEDTQNTHEEKDNDDNKIELFDLDIEKSPIEGFGTINLSNVKPIPFPFQISQASDELSLPEELIEEFVHDFITQAHEETQKMLEAYEKGDLDTIQKIGHLLKGTSSNLRIHALADTLYNIQFCEDKEQLEDFIKQYWGHFLSFEQQVNTLTNKGKN